MSGIEARRFLVEGRVQGVWFRASTREQALRLGVSGYAKNLADGRVEVLAEGHPDALEELSNWLKQGPRLAKVTNLRTEACDPAALTDFSIA